MLKFKHQTREEGIKRIFDIVFNESDPVLLHKYIYSIVNMLNNGDISEEEIKSYLASDKGKSDANSKWGQYKSKLNTIAARYKDMLSEKGL
jgi:deoxyhypusine synthase